MSSNQTSIALSYFVYYYWLSDAKLKFINDTSLYQQSMLKEENNSTLEAN